MSRSSSSKARSFATDGERDAQVPFPLALGCTLLGATSSIAQQAAKPSGEIVQKTLLTRLPRTRVNKVDCTLVQGLCEVQAGANIFYVDQSARYLVVGRIYDMETRQDLTAARLLEINPDTLLGGAATSAASGADAASLVPKPAVASAGRGVAAATNEKVSLTELPASGAIAWGGAGPQVTVFSDFHCGYCRLLHQAFKELGARVTERPISILGTRSISESVICAPDKADAVDKAYGQEPVTAKTCDTSGLDANERFARDHGFDGTPVLVRADGAVLRGYRPKEFIAAWLKEAGK
jgi:thiol:disulfide interchange protein DsbC